MENEDLGTNLPPTKLPREEDIPKIVEHAVNEEEVPSQESLFEDGHLAESTTVASVAEEYRIWCFGLDEHGRTHLDTAAEPATTMSEEPILGNGEARVVVERFDEEGTVP